MALLVSLLTASSLGGCSSMRELAYSDPDRASRMAIQALGSSDESRRREGAEILGETGAVNAEVVAALAAALGDKSPRVWWMAACSLQEIGPSAAGAVPALIDVLLHPERGNRWTLRECAWALGAIGPTARQALPVLSRRLKDGEPEVRICAAGAIGAIDPSRADEVLPILVEALRSGKWDQQECAAEMLAMIGPPARPAQRELARTVLSDDVMVSKDSARALVRLKADPKIAVPPLIRVLKSMDASPHGAYEWRHEGAPRSNIVRSGAAAEALGRLGAGSDEAVRALIDAVEVKPPKNPYHPTARELARPLFLSQSEVALFTRKEALWKTEPWWARGDAALALGRMRPVPKKAIPVLVAQLQDPTMRWHAMTALGEMGPAARSVVPELVGALSDRVTRNRRAAAAAILAIGLDNAQHQTAMVSAMDDTDLQVRVYAGGVVATAFQDLRDEAMCVLIAGLESKDIEARKAACITVAKIGPTASSCVPALARVLQHSSLEELRLAAKAVAAVGRQARDARPALIRLLNHPDLTVRRACQRALEATARVD
jgi:HEAT repeat protein